MAIGPASTPAASALTAAPQPSRSSADGFGVYGSAKGAASTAPTTPGRNNYGANPTTNPEGGTAPLDSQSAVQDSATPRGLLLAGSLVFLTAGLALLAIRRLTRRAAWS